MNYILEEALKLGADGVIFHPINLRGKDAVLDGMCEIHCIKTIEDLKKDTSYPKSDRTYYKLVDGKMTSVR
jgi:hypothetical protein